LNLTSNTPGYSIKYSTGIININIILALTRKQALAVTPLAHNAKKHNKNIESGKYIRYNMSISLILFLIGILGFVLNRKNIILMLISIEIMLLAITFSILIHSFNFDDLLGQVFAIYIIAIAGAESAIGLGILVAFYRLRGSIEINYK
jgi:NADH-ubiquinone oxidoreductase chain 4L